MSSAMSNCHVLSSTLCASTAWLDSWQALVTQSAQFQAQVLRMLCVKRSMAGQLGEAKHGWTAGQCCKRCHVLFLIGPAFWHADLP